MEAMVGAAATVEKQIADSIVAYSQLALNRSSFFSALGRQEVAHEALRAIFCQYRFWRDQFHTWFGVCILKSGSCADASVTRAVLSLAHHVTEELEDDHAGMYLGLLRKLGVSDHDLRETQKSPTTSAYEQSFFDRFGAETETFADSVIALSGRELFASIRNGFLIEHLRPYGVEDDKWLTAHEELELAHFYDAIRSFLIPDMHESEAQRMIGLAREEIDRHVAYWDDLWEDARASAA